MTNYLVGAERVITAPQGNAPAGVAAPKLPDSSRPCHAIDEAGNAACGYTGHFEKTGQGWDTLASLYKCKDCKAKTS